MSKRTKLLHDVMVKQERISVVFNLADRKNEKFYSLSEGLRYELDMHKVYKEMSKTQYSSYCASFLDKPVEVTITGIDDEKGVIICDYATSAEIKFANQKKKIESALAAGEKPACKARVIAITGKGKSSCAILSLENTGVKGVLWVTEWSTEFTPDIASVTKVGDMVDVVVIEQNTTSVNADYHCSRALAIKNPWLGVGDIIHSGDVVTVKIVANWNTDFAARIDGIPEIFAKVTLSNATPKDLFVEKGGRYLCNVIKANEQGHKIEVTPFRMAPQ